MERKMKKILIIIATMMSLSIHSQEGRYAMHAFYFIDVSNPVAVVGALDEFAASECGKKLPADVGLMAEGINGSAASTHFIIVSYENMEDFTKAGALMQTCPEAAKMLQGLASGSEAISEFGIIPAIEVGDWTKDTVFMKYDITTSNEAAYGKAWTELMKTSTANGLVSGSYGMNRIFLGNNEASHFVYIGAQNFETLVANQNAMTTSPAFEKFARKVGMVREVLNTSLIFPVKSWPKQ
jgi:hypothetical protein